MYALQKACAEFKTAASGWEIKDSGKFTEHTAQLAQTVKDDVDVQMEKYRLAMVATLQSPFNASSPTMIFQYYLGGADSQVLTPPLMTVQLL